MVNQNNVYTKFINKSIKNICNNKIKKSIKFYKKLNKRISHLINNKQMNIYKEYNNTNNPLQRN